MLLSLTHVHHDCQQISITIIGLQRPLTIAQNMFKPMIAKMYVEIAHPKLQLYLPHTDHPKQYEYGMRFVLFGFVAVRYQSISPTPLLPYFSLWDNHTNGPMPEKGLGDFPKNDHNNTNFHNFVECFVGYGIFDLGLTAGSWSFPIPGSLLTYWLNGKMP